MKNTVLEQVFTWGVWQTERRIDFNGFLWTRPAGGVLIDPMPLTDAERGCLEGHGGAACILVTNADHMRAAPTLAGELGARILAPAVDRERFGTEARHVDEWFTEELPSPLAEHAELAWLRGGKCPAEPALYLREERALFFADLVRSHESGRLRLLPDEKLSDRPALEADLRSLALGLPGGDELQAVLLADGDSLFTGAAGAWGELLASLD